MIQEALKYNRSTWILLAIVVLGFGLRMYQLNKHDFWYDEACTYGQISGRHSGHNQYLISHLSEKNPPFYFFILRQWSFLFGKSEFSLRFFSLFFNVLSIMLIYKLSKIFFDEITSLIATSFLAFSPFHIWYSQEVRMFTLSAFLSLLNTYLLFKALKNDNNKHWLGYFISFACLISTTYYAFFLLIPQTVLILYNRYNRRPIFKWAISIFSSFLFFLIFIFPFFINQLGVVGSNFWLPRPPTSYVILVSLNNFILGYNSLPIFYRIGLFLMLGVFFLACFNFPIKTNLILLSFFIVPIISIFIFSRIAYSIYLHRHLIIFSPFFYMFISKGIASIKYRLAKISVIFIFVSCIICSLVNYYQDILPFSNLNPGIYLKKKTKPIVSLFLQYKNDNDIIGFSNYGFTVTFDYYLRKSLKGNSKNKRFYFYLTPGDKIFLNDIRKMKYYGFTGHYVDDFVDLEKVNLNSFHTERIWLFSTS